MLQTGGSNMANAKPKYFLVEATALPEVFVKVTEAKSLLETGEARTVAEAVERRSEPQRLL